MKYYSPRTATFLIIANMVGAGVFLSLGEQLDQIDSTFPVLMTWLVYGLAVICGAMSYAELGAAYPRSGGEYNFLRRVYHPAAGFVSGWISATVGFAAPIAVVAMSFGTYVSKATPGLENSAHSEKLLAIALVLIATWFHTRNHKQSSLFQILFTALKIGLILLFCLVTLALVSDPQPVNLTPAPGDIETIFSSKFAVALLFVSFSYAGWNSATYILSEMESPGKDLPRVLITGTLVVTALYLLINFVLLKTASVENLKGKAEIIYISAQSVYGDWSSRAIAIMLASLLVSSVSAMTIAGPRAIQAIGQDYRLFSFLKETNANGQPMRAILLQTGIAIVLILTSSFKSVLIFAGGMLALNSFVAVLGVIVSRVREPNLERPFKVWLYPIFPLFFLFINGVTIYFTVLDNPIKGWIGLGIILAGLTAYWIAVSFEKTTRDKAQSNRL